MKKKVTYIVSDMSKMVALEWMCDFHDKSLTDLSFVFLNNGDSEIEQFVKIKGYKYLRIPYRGKKDLPAAFIKTVRFLKSNKTQVIHCHLFDACIVGLSAGIFCNIKKRIYTRHYATFHHVYFPNAVKYDHLINWMATDIIAISELVKNVLIDKENVNPQKIHLINHAFLIDEYADVGQPRIDAFKAKYGIHDSDLVIGVVARYTLLKGIQYIIPAFIQLLENYPNCKLLIANSKGNDEAYLKGLLSKIPSKNLIEVVYERYMGALYKSLNVYVHVPIYDHIEAFGQTYVEALMAKTPSVFTLSGIAQEFIVHERNALVVEFEKSEPIYTAIVRLLSDQSLCESLSEQGFADVKANFDLPIMVNKLDKLYIS